MIKKKALFIFLAVFVVCLSSCAPSYSSLDFLLAQDSSIPLIALDTNAKNAELQGETSHAWFAFNEPLFNLEALEIQCKIEGGEGEVISLGLLAAEDFTTFPRLRKNPVARNVSELTNLYGDFAIRMAIPSNLAQQGLYGFVLKLNSTGNAKIKLVKALSIPKEIGWDRSSPIFWTGFNATGGSIDAQNPFASLASTMNPLVLHEGTVLKVKIDPQGATIGSPARQERIFLQVGERKITIRLSPRSYTTTLPARFFTENNPMIEMQEDFPYIQALRIQKENPDLSALVDPHIMLEWPESQWKNPNYEVFAWDRFPSVFIFDTKNYAIQDALFKRLAFFVEKQGYRGRLVAEKEIAHLHGFNAHDYRAESLAEFFNAARKASRESHFVLNEYEKQLEAFLFQEGIIQLQNDIIIPGVGAVLSISRESVAYLRYLFMAHEGYHGIYFVTPEYREKVAQVYRGQDQRALDFLQSYFTVVDSLGYDLEDPYLMENEFMAYLMQQSIAQVSSYFTTTIADRYLRYKGNAELAYYVKETQAQSFVDACSQLNDYVFTNWGIVSGRVGLFSFQ